MINDVVDVHMFDLCDLCDLGVVYNMQSAM